jgi:hypothetical protein
LRVSRTVANSTVAATQSNIGSRPRGDGEPGTTSTPPASVRHAVVMVKVVLAEVLPGEALVGLNEIIVPVVGAPVCENVTVCGNPPVPAVTVMGKIAVWPAATATTVLGPDTVKSLPVPCRVTVCVVGVASSVKVSVAVRDPEAVGVNVTFTAQVPEPGTGVAVVQVVPLATAKSDAFVPVMVAATEKCSDASPWFVTVAFCAVLGELRVCAENVSVLAARSAVAGVRVPIPVSITVCVAGVASSVNVSAAVRDPAAVGVKVMFSTHVPEPDTGVAVVQVVPLTTAKSDAFAPVIAGATEKCNGA